VTEHNILARAISSSFAVIAIVTLDPAFYLLPSPLPYAREIVLTDRGSARVGER